MFDEELIIMVDESVEGGVELRPSVQSDCGRTCSVEGWWECGCQA